MGKKSILKISYFGPVLAVAAAILLMAGNQIFANYSFNSSDYPDLCFAGFENTGGILNVTAHNCGVNETSSMTYNSSLLTSPANLVVSCTYTYSSWSGCSNGVKTRFIISPSQRNYACSNPSTESLEQDCATVCKPTCNTSGAKQCYYGSVNYFQSCDLSDGCLKWGVPIACPTGKSCHLGNCVNCIPGAVDGCKVCDSAGTAWVDADSKCAAGQACSNGTCAAATAYCTSYAYGKWSACDTTGNQKKTITTKTPLGCVLPTSVAETVKQFCAYVDPTVYCASHNYGNWSPCASGFQSRSISVRYPGGCYLPSSVAETETRSCVDVPLMPALKIGSLANGGTVSGNLVIDVDLKNGDGIHNVKFYIDNVLKATDTAAPYIYSWDTTGEAGPKKHSIKVEACDAAGVVKAGSIVEVTVVNAVEPAADCESYVYGDWSICGAAGTQTRKVLSKLPAGCVEPAGGMSAPALERSCEFTKICESYNYTGWSACDRIGTQTRKIISSLPSGCAGGTDPVLEQKCVPAEPPACVYDCSIWGACEPGGKQTRKLISQTPQNCLQKEAPVLEQNCDYLPPQTGATEVGGVNTGAPAASCFYVYSDWGACVSARQTRIVVSKSPLVCDQTVLPELARDCDKSAVKLPPLALDAPLAVPQSMLAPVSETTAENLNGRTSAEWQKYYFGLEACLDEFVCAGGADPDNDGVNNNDEYRFGTNPKSPDTDLDGRVDADEIANGRNPLLPASATFSDAVVYESPKIKGKELGEIYRVTGIDYATTTQELIITGKALPDSYATVYLYSKQPAILTVKTDSEGNWQYIVDKPEDGTHEVYVVVNDNNGRVTAKSAAFAFVQTVEAAAPIDRTPVINMEKAPAPVKTRLAEGYFIAFAFVLGGFVLALAAIGLSRSMGGQKKEQ